MIADDDTEDDVSFQVESNQTQSLYKLVCDDSAAEKFLHEQAPPGEVTDSDNDGGPKKKKSKLH